MARRFSLPATFSPTVDDPAVRATTLYMICSVGMVVANKEAATRLQAGTILLAMQQLATILVACVLHILGSKEIRGNMHEVIRWSPIAVLSGLILWTGMQALMYASLSTLTVIRNASPLILLGAERLMFGVPITKDAIISLSTILIGVVIYCSDDISTKEALGIFLVVLDAAFVCLDRLAQRYLLQEMPVSLSSSALVLVSNAVGLLFSFALLFYPMHTELHEVEWTPAGISWSIASCIGGAAIAYAGIGLSRNLSATAALVVTNIDKVLVLCYGVMMLGDHFDSTKLCGCTFALVGGTWHAWGRLRAGEEKKQELKTEIIQRLANSLRRGGYRPQDLFSKLDADGSGRLSRQELLSIVLRFEPGLTPTEQDAIFQRFDADNSGCISWAEFWNTIQGGNSTAGTGGQLSLPQTLPPTTPGALLAPLQPGLAPLAPAQTVGVQAGALERTLHPQELQHQRATAEEVIRRIAAAIARSGRRPHDFITRLDARASTLSRSEVEQTLFRLEPSLSGYEREAVLVRLGLDRLFFSNFWPLRAPACFTRV
ncbi:GFT1 [Symbiodinium sp. CCMP2592]|nr:GFT1 [Symbiodinium sp. CCMP2592]